MEINEYQQLALTTLNKELTKDQVLLNGMMGLCGESGEAIDLLKKHLCHGHELDKDKLILELGDIAWYLAIASYALDVDLENVLSLNVEKLKKRYPGGFSKEKSINRKI
jgi:NTP pyrophosphatase (non-canonical NTP hydrolase)